LLDEQGFVEIAAMKLHSVYLNPFQPFPERELDDRGVERPRDALEDNLSRAVFSALGNAESARVLALFLQALAKDSSPQLRERTDALAELLRNTDVNKVEVGLQSWPAAAVRERAGTNVLLIGISSCHYTDWTHDKRPAPSDARPDAWIYVPGALLLVFECKNDEHPLDATQVSAYAHQLLLVTSHDVPRAEPGSTLSPTQAQVVQKACVEFVLDSHWDAVVATLEHIQQVEFAGTIGRWLSGQVAAYIQLHVRPPYRGIHTLLDWLNGPDDAGRRDHLRRLVIKMGEQLALSGQDHQDAITFAQEDFRPGAGAALYVQLRRGGQPLERLWLGRRAPVVLWFQFRQGIQLNDEDTKRIGLEYYIQAPGAHPAAGKGVDGISAWNAASDRHQEVAKEFEQQMAEWSDKASSTCKVEVTSVQFNGKKRNWQGGGVQDNTGPHLPPAAPQEALAFLKANQGQLWRFPRVKDSADIEMTARQVRKPALSLIAPLETSALAACGADARTLQDLLQKAVASIDAVVRSEPS
jgi:hypothetical protein